MLGLIAFLPALWGPWLLDDGLIRDAIATVHAGGWGALADGGWRQHLFLGPSGIGRPLAMATFAANAAASSEPFGFKAVNLALHLIIAALVYLLTRVLLRTAHPRGSADAAALAVALLWALHPLQLGTVGYVVQRMTLLAALWTLLAMWLYARRRVADLAGGGGSQGFWLVPLVLLPGLAVLSKETGALTPYLLLTLELTLFRFRGPPGTRRLLALYFGLAALAGAAVTFWLVLDPSATASGYVGRAFDMGERLLTQARVLALYLGQILLPRLDAMPFYYDALPPSRGWLEPPATLIGGLVLAALVGAGLALARRRPVAACGLALFFVGHLMESTVLPLELAFEHRNYLPSLGLILAGVDLAAAAWGRLGRAGPLIAGVAVLALFGLTLVRALTWSDAERLYAGGLAGPWPSPRAHADLAQLYTDRGDLGAARAVLARLAGPGPRLQEIYLDCREGPAPDPARLPAARAQLGSVVGDYDASALIVVANLALDGPCRVPRGELLGLLEAAAAAPILGPGSRQKLLMYVGHLRHALDDGPGAFAALEAAFAVGPGNPMPLLLAAHWHLDTGDSAVAQVLYDRARASRTPARLDLSEPLAGVAQRLGQGPSAPASY